MLRTTDKRRFSKETIQKLITINGKPIALDRFDWCSKCSNLKIWETIENLKIDFSNMNGIHIQVIDGAEIKAGKSCFIEGYSFCNIECDSYCYLILWNKCTIKAKCHNNINVCEDCNIQVISDNYIECCGNNQIEGNYSNIIRSEKDINNKTNFLGNKNTYI